MPSQDTRLPLRGRSTVYDHNDDRENCCEISSDERNQCRRRWCSTCSGVDCRRWSANTQASCTNDGRGGDQNTPCSSAVPRFYACVRVCVCVNVGRGVIRVEDGEKEVIEGGGHDAKLYSCVCVYVCVIWLYNISRTVARSTRLPTDYRHVDNNNVLRILCANGRKKKKIPIKLSVRQGQFQ